MKRSPGGRTPRGMTLVELLAVMAIILIVTGIAATTFVSRQANLQLSTSVVQLQGLFTQARQIALSRNKYVQVRFYRPKPPAGGVDPALGYEGVGMFLAESPFYDKYDQWIAQGLFRAEGRAEFLPDAVVIPFGDVSKLLASLTADTALPRTGSSTVGGRGYAWVAFYFRPNGATDFQTVSGQPYALADAGVSVVPRTAYQKTKPALPANFASFTFTPINGECTVVRP